MDKRLKTELRVGFFFNLGIALILLTLFLFGGPAHFFSKKLHYRFYDDNAEGLIRGAKVMVAGVNAGVVDQVRLDPETAKVRVDFDIEPRFEASLREGSFVQLETLGVLGDKVVMVQPGNPRRPALPDQAVLPMHPSVSIGRLLATGNLFLRHLDRLTTGIDSWVAGLGSKGRAKETGANASQVMRNLSELTGRWKNLDVAKVNSAIANLNGILEKVDDGNGSLGALVNDPELYDDAKALVGEANQNRIVRNLVRLSVKDSEQKNVAASGG